MNRSSLSCIFMNPLILATFLISVSVWPGLASGQAACAAVVAANVEVTRGELSLEDLLPRSACPALLRAASRVHLGKAPLPGSVRVLEGNQIRAWLQPHYREGRERPWGVCQRASAGTGQRATRWVTSTL